MLGQFPLKYQENLCITIFNQPCVAPKDWLTDFLQLVISNIPTHAVLGPIKG